MDFLHWGTHEVWLNYIASKKENGTLYLPLPTVLVSDLERCLESDGTRVNGIGRSQLHLQRTFQ